jgi:hypothetical protein
MTTASWSAKTTLAQARDLLQRYGESADSRQGPGGHRYFMWRRLRWVYRHRGFSCETHYFTTTEEESDEIFRSLDTDGDGLLSREEA